MFWAITKKKADGLASILILRDYLASLIHHHSESKTLTELVQISGIHSLKLVLSRFKILYSGHLDLRSVSINHVIWFKKPDGCLAFVFWSRLMEQKK